MTQHIDTNLRLQNDSQVQGDDWWKWSIWLEGPPEEMAQVQSVTYRLHPTFSSPIQEVKDRSDSFRLRASGWGEFSISAQAQLQDGRVVRLERWLELRDAQGQRNTDPEDDGGHRPTVFISHSLADDTLVQALHKGLEDQGVEIWTAWSIESGVDLQTELKVRLTSADLVVAIVSAPPSRAVREEALTALSAGRTVIAVAVGNAEIPSVLQQSFRVALDNPANANPLIDLIAARVKDLTVPEES